MKALYFLCILLALPVFTFAQNKISREEYKTRLEWVQKQLKKIPPGAQQKDIEKYYSSLPKSTLDSLLEFQAVPDPDPIIVPNNRNQTPFKAIPIPPYEGKEKIIPIPLKDPDARAVEIKR